VRRPSRIATASARRRLVMATAGFIVTSLLVAGPPPARAADPAPMMTGAEKEAVEDIVRAYIRAHPEIVIEAIEAWREQQRLAQEEKTRQTIVAEGERLFLRQNDPSAGNPAGDVTVVEFFDYNCGYCKRVMESFLETVDQDGKVRIVFKEFPILGADSRFAAEAALAARNQGKYFEFHRALMGVQARVSRRVVLTVAKSVGLDLDKLQEDMKSPAVQAVIADNLKLAEALGIRGTPAFVVGEKLAPGAVDAATLKSLIADARG